MRVVVTGASGNIGTRVLDRLTADPELEVVAVARRIPAEERRPRVRWVAADLVTAPLADVVRGADAVVHLAWAIQPTRDPARLWEVNAVASARLLEACVAAGVGAVVHASSVGVYSPRPRDDRRVDESWPTHGIATATYSVAKAYVERLLDWLDATSGGPRVVRLRPALALQPDAATRLRRLFLGVLVPRGAVRPDRIPVVPRIPGVSFQVVHPADVADAVHAALRREVTGAFNLATEPRLDLEVVAELLGARSVPVAAGAARAAMAATWRARLQPVDPGWFDILLRSPGLDTTRARDELGWSPDHGAGDLLVDTIEAIAAGRGRDLPPLRPDSPAARRAELRSRQGAGEVRP
jgi:UDP-glucose 4-epimerase